MFWKILAVSLFLTAMTISAQTPPVETGVSQELAKWRAANYSDVRYILNLTIEKNAPTLKGTIEVRVKVSEPRAIANGSTPIILDWRKIKGHEQLSKISNVSVNGKSSVQSTDFSRLSSDKLPPEGGTQNVYYEINEHLVFRENIKPGENTIKLDFESPILTSGSAVTRYIDKEDGSEYIYSLFVPSDASTAFPVFDQPDLKARFSLVIKRKADWRAISNTTGIDFGLQGQNDKFTSFLETKPISTYLFAFAIGNFKEFKEIDYVKNNRLTVAKSTNEEFLPCKNPTPKENKEGCIETKDVGSKIFVRKSQAKKFKPHAEEIFRLNRESIKYLEDYFDYKFPFPKYDLVLIPEFPFGGMEHAGATFLRESAIIFPTEPTANNYISRALLLFHENAHQWFGDTVTMKWFDDLWLKEGFATFTAYKTLEKVMPEYNAWKIFYERTKPLAYATDVTKGTTPIYQQLPNLNSAKSAYGNIVYQKAPGFLRQAEFYLGEKEFQTAVRSFLKKHEFANAEWSDLVDEFEKASGEDLKSWANIWVTKRGVNSLRPIQLYLGNRYYVIFERKNLLRENTIFDERIKVLIINNDGTRNIHKLLINDREQNVGNLLQNKPTLKDKNSQLIFPNYQDYGYGIFLLDEKSRKYILENIQNEKDDFLRSMMWGSLWDSVRFAELAPVDYVELAIKNINVEKDVSTIGSILARVDTAFTYYLSDVQQKQIAPKLENLLIDKMKNAATLEQRITFYRAFVNAASSENARKILKEILSSEFKVQGLELRTKDKFDIVTKLVILGDEDASKLLAELEKTEKGDAAERYAYAAKAGFSTAENKAKFWNDFTKNKDLSESWIEEAVGVWNAPGHADLTLPYLEKALAELPALKQNRKIFFINNWLASFIGGQKSEKALEIVNKFLKENPNLDADLQRKILERVDGLERAVKIREKYPSGA